MRSGHTASFSSTRIDGRRTPYSWTTCARWPATTASAVAINASRRLPVRAINSQNGLAVWNGATPTFYRRGATYAQSSASQTPPTAAISNYPLLLQGGAVVDSTAEQSPTQMLRGTKGAIGVDGTYVYLAIVTGATMTESAFALQALGVRDALNLDGGGTAAMWIGGSYKVGPGRQLPNAVVITKP